MSIVVPNFTQEISELFELELYMIDY
jgi:hypothetical protein